MDRLVLDSSALLAFLRNEPGGEEMTRQVLSLSVMSTVNLAEVQGRLQQKGLPEEQAWEQASGYISVIEPFTAAQARLAGSLITQTRPFGLSLGDRACLALAITLDAPVYTADRAWKTLDVGCRIHIIR